MAAALKPLGDRVVVRPITREEVTAAGIVLPDTAKDRPQEGEIMAVGPGRLTEEGKVIPMELKTGDKVIFSKFAGTEVKVENQEYLIMSERDILAKLG
ncbi:MAG: co-chaperone GroES [Chloroflexi bacterium]|nr:co-chaperone GroES [Chloroflexota bacterium]